MSVARKLILAVFCIAQTPSVLADNIKDVNIVNTPTVNANIVSTEPIAVTGAVDINGPLEAMVTGPVDVSGSTVTLGNIEPVPITNVDQPKSSEIIQLSSGSGGTTVCSSGGGRPFFRASAGIVQSSIPYIIPTDKQLLVRSISFEVEGSDAGQYVLFTILKVQAPFANTAFRSGVLTDVNGTGFGLFTISPGFFAIGELCFFPPAAGNSRVSVYAYVVDR